MAVILGIGLLRARRCWPTASTRPPPRTRRCCRSWARRSSASGTVLYYVLQFSTFAILILAANTAYADFPRLSSIIARDEFLPHQFKNRGDRLVFSNGIVVLAVMAVRADRRLRRRDHRADPALRRRACSPGSRSARPAWSATSAAQRDRAGRRAWSSTWSARSPPASCSWWSWCRSSPVGAWLPAVVIPAIVVLFKAIGRHYARRAGGDQRARRVAGPPPHPHGGRARRQRQQGDAAGHRLRPLAGARTGCSPSAWSPTTRRPAQLTEQWAKHDIPVELHTLHSPYRNLTRPVLRFLDELDAEARDDIITVVIPEFVVNRWYLQVLHNQTALALKARLLFRPQHGGDVGADPHRRAADELTPPGRRDGVRDAVARHVLDHRSGSSSASPIASDGGAPPAPPQDRRPAGVRLRRHLLHRLRHRRDPGRAAHPGPHRCRGLAVPGAHRPHRLRAADHRGRSATARRSTPTRAAAAATSSAGRTWGRSRRWWPARRCWSTTPSRWPCRWPAACSPSAPRPGSTSKWTVPLCLSCIVLMTARQPARGARSPGGLFAGPTYFYVVMLVILIVTGLIRIFVFDLGPHAQADHEGRRAAPRMTPDAVVPHAAAGLLVRRGRAVRRGGGVQRRARPSSARSPATPSRTLISMALDPRHHVPRRLDPGRPPPALPRRGGRRPASRSWRRGSTTARASCSG